MTKVFILTRQFLIVSLSPYFAVITHSDYIIIIIIVIAGAY